MIAFNEHGFRVALAVAGFKHLAQLADRVGISRSLASFIVGGYLTTPEIRGRIAEVLGVDEGVIWRRVRVGDL